MKVGGATVFALTGGIGSGKSTVAQLFRDEGLPVVDADQLARAVVEPGTPGLARLVATFGTSVLDTEGRLARARLGELVFDHPARRAELERLLHPLIAEAARARFEELASQGHTLIAYEIPLLFETQQAERFRPVVVVYADEPSQLQRAGARDGADHAAIHKRVQAQLPLEHKRKQADFVIDNSASRAETAAQAREVLAAIRQLSPGAPEQP